MDLDSILGRDISTLRELLESFSRLTGVASALIDLDGVVLVGARWQRACTDFHRACPASAARCLESDTTLASEMTAGASTAVYRCRNGLTDAAAPVVVDGLHVANAFIGQFLLEPPDLDWFREQARALGYDEDAYVSAIREVPVVSEASLPAMLSFLTTAARLTAELALRHARERVEAGQRAEWARFLTIMDSFPEVLYVTDPETYEVVWVNQVFADALGRDPVGGLCYREFQGLDRPCSFCTNDVILSRPGVHTWEHWNPLTERHYLIRDQIIQWPDGRRLRFEVATDITERKEAEIALAAQREALARSNRELEQFAYVASHDLQEPLRAISGFARLLEKRYAGRLDESADEYIGFITDGADRLGQMIRDLLAYSRVNTRGQAFQSVDTAALLSAVLRDLDPAINEAGATVTHDSLPEIVADSGQVRQVFQNLISNALRFRGSAPPLVQVSGEELPDAWRFEVRDNGIGLDPAHAERIFVIFQRLESREHYPGTGIGLAICKRVVERHGGQIGVDSRPGEGARFWFTLAKREADRP